MCPNMYELKNTNKKQLHKTRLTLLMGTAGHHTTRRRRATGSTVLLDVVRRSSGDTVRGVDGAGRHSGRSGDGGASEGGVAVVVRTVLRLNERRSA